MHLDQRTLPCGLPVREFIKHNGEGNITINMKGFLEHLNSCLPCLTYTLCCLIGEGETPPSPAIR